MLNATRYALSHFNLDRRSIWKNGNVRSVVISTIRGKAILMKISLQILPLKNCLTPGSVRHAEPQRICSKRFSASIRNYSNVS